MSLSKQEEAWLGGLGKLLVGGRLGTPQFTSIFLGQEQAKSSAKHQDWEEGVMFQEREDVWNNHEEQCKSDCHAALQSHMGSWISLKACIIGVVFISSLIPLHGGWYRVGEESYLTRFGVQQSYDAEERQGKQRSAWPRKLSKEQKGIWRDGQHHNGRRCKELQIPLDQRLLELWCKREWARRIRYDGQQVWHLKFRLWRGHRHRWQHSFAKILPSPWKLGSLEREVQKLRDGVLEGSPMLTLKSKYKNNF